MRKEKHVNHLELLLECGNREGDDALLKMSHIGQVIGCASPLDFYLEPSPLPKKMCNSISLVFALRTGLWYNAVIVTED